MNKNVRIILGIVFLLMVLISSFFLIKYWDIAFDSKVRYEYLDGCIEEFVNGELITPECYMGRMNRKQIKEGVDWQIEPSTNNDSEWMKLNLTI